MKKFIRVIFIICLISMLFNVHQVQAVASNNLTIINLDDLNKKNVGNGDLPFTDLDSTKWYMPYITYVYNKNLMTGYTATTFAPNEFITRGQVVTILYRNENQPVSTYEMNFNDIPSTLSEKYYYEPVRWAAENGIVTGFKEGVNAGKFKPNDNITREQFAVILQRYANYQHIISSKTDDLTGFSDYSSVSNYAINGVKWAVGNGIIKGNADKTLNPNGNATRAESSAMIMRYCEELKNEIPDAEGSIQINLSTEQYVKSLEMTLVDNKAGEYDVYYKLGESGEWTKYENAVTLTENTTIYVRYQDDKNNVGKEASKEVTNIDTTVPNEFTPEVTVTTHSITINSNTTDNKTSTENLIYFYKVDDEESYTQGTTTYALDDLIQNTEHTVNIKVVDEAGNERIVSVVRTTLTVPEYDVSNATGNGNIITASNVNAEYQLVYAIGDSEEFVNYDNQIESTEIGTTTIKFKYKDVKNQFGVTTQKEIIVVPSAVDRITINPSTEEDYANSVTISLNDSIQKEELNVQYKIGENGVWTKYTEPFDIIKDATIYARYVASDDDNNGGVPETKIINNLDLMGTIYFKRPILNTTPTWPLAYVYFFKTGEITGSWPGREMTHIGNNIYKYDVKKTMFVNIGKEPNTDFKLIFNRGGDKKMQTVDLDFEGFDKIFIVDDSSINSGIAQGDWADYNLEVNLPGKIYFKKPESWNNAYLYAFTIGDQKPLGSWPGSQMELVDDDIYSIELTQEDFEGIDLEENKYFYLIFNGGADSNQQTVKRLFTGFNKLFTVTDNENSKNAVGVWSDYQDSNNNN